MLGINGQTGSVLLTSADANITVSSPTAGTVQLQNNAVPTVNGQHGPITVASADGSLVVSEPSGGLIELTNLAVPSVNGQTGPITVTGSTGLVVTEPSGGHLSLTNTGVTFLNGETGSIILSSPDSSLNVVNGSGTISVESPFQVFDSSSVRHPTARIITGFGVSGSGGDLVLNYSGLLSSILSVTATYQDSGLVDAISIASRFPSGGAVTLNARFVDTQPPTAATGIGIYWTIIGLA